MFSGGEQLPWGLVKEEFTEARETRMLHNTEETVVSFTNDLWKWRVQEATLIKMWFRNGPAHIGLV